MNIVLKNGSDDQPPLSKAPVEYDVLRNVHKLVESDYVNGRPRHHLDSARNPSLQDGASIFFIVEHDDFAKMSTQQKQDIAKHRNIVVRNVPQPKFEWNSKTISEFGDMHLPREIQGVLPSDMHM